MMWSTSATATDHLQRTGAHANHHAVRAVHASICAVYSSIRAIIRAAAICHANRVAVHATATSQRI